MSPEHEKEVLDRIRRIETRVTATASAVGVKTGKKPEFSGDPLGGLPEVRLPSIHTPMRDIIDSIPDTCDTPVKVMLGDVELATLKRPG